MSDFSESGLVLARNGKRYDFINSVGIKQYDKVFEFSEEGVAAERLNGKYFFVDSYACAYVYVDTGEDEQEYKINCVGEVIDTH